MSDSDDCARRSEVAALRRRVAVLEAAFAQMYRQRYIPDARLGAVLVLIHAFAHSTARTAGELLEDARRADRDLWCALDAIVGDRGDPAIRLGLWLQRHVDADGDGLVLTRVRKECGAWMYAVQPVE